jgi:hypothetical protein
LAAQQLPSCEAAKSYRFELGRQALGSHFAVTSQGTWKALGRGGFGHLEATWKARRASGAGAARHHVAPFFWAPPATLPRGALSRNLCPN